jgi:hypothetical protein
MDVVIGREVCSIVVSGMVWIVAGIVTGAGGAFDDDVHPVIKMNVIRKNKPR